MEDNIWLYFHKAEALYYFVSHLTGSHEIQVEVDALNDMYRIQLLNPVEMDFTPMANQ